MDIESLKSVVMILLSAFGGVLWWAFQDVKSKVDDSHKNLSDYKLYVSEHYVKHDELAKAMEALKDVMFSLSRQLGDMSLDLKEVTRRFTDKLDTKQDK